MDLYIFTRQDSLHYYTTDGRFNQNTIGMYTINTQVTLVIKSTAFIKLHFQVGLEA